MRGGGGSCLIDHTAHMCALVPNSYACSKRTYARVIFDVYVCVFLRHKEIDSAQQEDENL